MAGINVPVTFTGDMSSITQGLDKSLSGLSGGFGNAAAKAAENFGNRLSSDFAQAGRVAMDLLGGVLSGAAVSVGTVAAAGIATALNKGFSRLINIDNAETKLRALGKTTEEVTTIMEAANNAVDGTAYSLDAAATAAATLGAAGVGLDDMETSLRQIGALATTTGSDFSEIADIYGIMAANGKVTGDVLQRLTQRGSDAAARLAEHFGVTREELTKMVSSSKVSFEDFQEAMSGLDEAAVIAGGSFSSMVANIQTNLGKLGANLLGPIFDQLKGEDGVLSGILEQIKALRPVTEAWGEALGEAFYVLFGGLTGQSEVGEFEGALGKLNDVAVTINETFTNIGEKVSAFWEKLSGGQKAAGVIALVAGGIAAFGSALAPLLTALGPVGALIGKMVPTLGGLGGAFRFLLGPVGIIIGLFATAFATSEEFRGAIGNLLAAIAPLAMDLISALVPALGQLGGLFEQVVKAVTPLLTAFVNIATEIISTLLPPITQLIADVLPVVMSLFEAVVPVIESLIPIIIMLAEQFAAVLIPVIEMLLPIVSDVIQGIVPLIEQLVTIVGGVIETIAALMSGDWSGAWEAFKGVVTGAVDFLFSLIDTFKQISADILQGLLDGLEGKFGEIGAWFHNLGTSILDWFKSVLGISSPSTVFLGFGKDILQGLINGLKALLGSVGAAVTSVGTKMVSLFTGAKNKVVGVFTSLVSSVKGAVTRLGSAVSSGISGVVSTMTSLPGKILGALGNVGSLLYNAGRSIIQGLMNGISSMIGSVKGAVGNVLGAARRLLPSSPAKEGPFSGRGWSLYSGEAIGDALADGMLNRMRAVKDAAEMMMGAAADPVIDMSAPRGPKRVASAPPVASAGGSGTTVNINEFGPRTYSAKRREGEWAGKYSTRARTYTDGALAIP